MAVIGFLTEKKKEKELEQLLKEEMKEMGKRHTIITINEKSIENVKNIKFEIIIIDYNPFGSLEVLKNILLKTDKLLVNSDFVENLAVIENLKLSVITYGFNSKSTITASSIDEEGVLICVQRSIHNLEGSMIEPQEVKMTENVKYNNMNFNMILLALSLLYDKKWNFM